MTLLDLLHGTTPLKRYSNRNGGEYRGACPGCGGDANSDRFIVWPETNRYWCRQCGKSGDALQFLRDFRGYSFQDAARMVGKALPEKDRALEERKRQARDAILQRFYTWRHTQRRQLTLIGEELYFAEMAYRSICRAPDVWTQDEQAYWIAYLGDLYLALDRVREETDQLMDDRTAWERWKEETYGVIH